MSATLLTGIARTTEPQLALRRFLALDAVVTGVNGAAYAAASGPLGRFLGVDSGFLLGLGVFLVLYAVALGVLAGRRSPAGGAVSAVVEANLLYAALSFVSAVLWFDPTTAGAVWIPLQAVVVALFAVLQYTALRAVRR
ncbi:hypothetical protein [Streptomyces yaizuensis]|uniref:Integral membrane protein n=1 Tax=Streptomyces yaizuensis TaxID=2989713 RepID=A0ABQ5P6T9_9ACTN|nr:hypothetical protein [Streptomyces sp. YSPA8]GLF98292.1 hypothetical protein SYYSPA8_28365 [Streptomyces sp. YSPA8]